MFLSSRKPYVIFAVSVLLLALTTAVAGSTPQAQETVLQSSPVSMNNSPEATIGTTFTYQGRLTDGGSPANGEFDFRYLLYDALVGGSQVGPIVTSNNLQVTDGLFTTALDFGGVFTGTALWLEIGVRDGNSGGAYTILQPRQPLNGAPYALGLLPEATLSNPAGNALVISEAGNHGLLVESTTDEGVRINTAGDDGVFINSAGSDGVQVSSAADDGFDVSNAGNNGVFVGIAGDDGIQINNATNNGIEINAASTGLNIVDATLDAIHIDSAGLDGVDVNLSVNDGFQVDSAGRDGLHVGQAGEDGVHVEHADGDGIFICATGTETTCTPSISSINGVEIGNTEDDGVRVISAGDDGFQVDSAGDYGVWVGTAGNDGVRVDVAADDGVQVLSAGDSGVDVVSAGDNGVDVAGDNLAGYFSGNIQVTGNFSGCLLATFGVNTSSETLQPGDLVTVQGTQIIANDSTPMLMEVASTKPGQTVIGVVGGWAELVPEEDPRPTEIGLRLIPREGPAEPGAYVTIIYSGPVQVRVDALDGTITAGTRLTIGDQGGVRTLQTTEVNGITLAESAPVLGIALSEPDADGLVWVLVNPQ